MRDFLTIGLCLVITEPRHYSHPAFSFSSWKDFSSSFKYLLYLIWITIFYSWFCSFLQLSFLWGERWVREFLRSSHEPEMLNEYMKCKYNKRNIWCSFVRIGIRHFKMSCIWLGLAFRKHKVSTSTSKLVVKLFSPLWCISHVSPTFMYKLLLSLQIYMAAHENLIYDLKHWKQSTWALGKCLWLSLIGCLVLSK